MNPLSSIICLLLGLVIQISGIQPLAADAPAPSCSKAGMSCCEGARSCPCAEDRDPDQSPAPAVPADNPLKWFVSKAGTSDDPAIILPSPAGPVVSNTSSVDCTGGYAGVPLSVAFCTFVI